MGVPSLPPRLRAVADLVPACGRVVDVGTDHALLPIALVAEGRCARALARDLREGPVAVARRNVGRARLSDRIAIECADGLDGLVPEAGDVVVVAGLGGAETAAILRRGEASARAAAALVLQPMRGLAELRAFLDGAGYLIGREALAQDGGRLYAVLQVRSLRPGDPPPPPLDLLERWLGRDLLARRPDGFRAYAAALRRRLEKEARGLSASPDPEDAAAAAERRALIDRIDGLHYAD